LNIFNTINIDIFQNIVTIFTASMIEWLMSDHACLVCRRSTVQILDQPNLSQHCKRFVTTSTSTQVAVLPWCYRGDGHCKLVTCFDIIQQV